VPREGWEGGRSGNLGQRASDQAGYRGEDLKSMDGLHWTTRGKPTSREKGGYQILSIKGGELGKPYSGCALSRCKSSEYSYDLAASYRGREGRSRLTPREEFRRKGRCSPGENYHIKNSE